MLFTIGIILFFGLAFDLITSLLAAYEWRKAWMELSLQRMAAPCYTASLSAQKANRPTINCFNGV